MNKKALIISGFISFFSIEIMSIISAISMGRMSNTPADKIIRIIILFSIMIGLFGILLSLIFSKIQNFIPLKSLTLKLIIYFICLNTIFTGIKGINTLLTLDFALGTIFSIIGAFIFSFLYSKLEKTK